MTQYLSVEEIVAIHKRVLEDTGGREGIHDAGLLFAACEKPKTVIAGQEMYPDLFTKAAVLLEALANYHTFSDGNKRTAYLSAKTFLAMNGLHLKVKTKMGLAFILSVANKERDRETITAWLKRHAKPI